MIDENMRSRDPELNLARRQAILDAAANCFVRQGFHATSMKDICVEAGMSPGTLYHFIRSKSDVIAGIIEAEGAHYRSMIAELASALDFTKVLLSAIERLTAEITERDLVLHAEIAAEILRQPELRKQAIATDTEMTAAFVSAIEMAKYAGSVDSDVDAHGLAVSLGALLDGMLARGALHGVEAMRREFPAVSSAVSSLLAAHRADAS